jgi:hypothetical protein
MRRARGGAVLVVQVDPTRVDTTGITGGGTVPPPTGRRDRDGPQHFRKSKDRSVERAFAPARASVRVATSLEFVRMRAAMNPRSPGAPMTTAAGEFAAATFAV